MATAAPLESARADAVARLATGRYLPGDVDLLPLTVDAAVVAGALGISTWSVYAQAREGSLPISHLALGRRLKWRTRKLLELLGVDEPTPTPQP